MAHQKAEKQSGSQSEEQSKVHDGAAQGGDQNPTTDPGMRDIHTSHRSIESQVEGGQNQWEGEPHPGYGNGQGGDGKGSNG